MLVSLRLSNIGCRHAIANCMSIKQCEIARMLTTFLMLFARGSAHVSNLDQQVRTTLAGQPPTQLDGENASHSDFRQPEPRPGHIPELVRYRSPSISFPLSARLVLDFSTSLLRCPRPSWVPHMLPPSWALFFYSRVTNIMRHESCRVPWGSASDQRRSRT